MKMRGVCSQGLVFDLGASWALTPSAATPAGQLSSLGDLPDSMLTSVQLSGVCSLAWPDGTPTCHSASHERMASMAGWPWTLEPHCMVSDLDTVTF